MHRAAVPAVALLGVGLHLDGPDGIDRADIRSTRPAMGRVLSIGVGINSVDVDDVSGPLVDGGTFDISVDAGTEALALAGLGGRWWFGDHWGAEAQVQVQRRFADWELVDRVSGATGTIDDYTVRGVLLTVLRRF